MSKTIAVGKALQELQDKIKLGYGSDCKVRITGVIVEVTAPNASTHEVVLTPHEKEKT